MTLPAQPPGQYPGAVPPPPPPSGRWRPERVDVLPGTDFGLVQFRVEPITSGLAIGSLIAGIGSILVSLLVLCFGLIGSAEGWGGGGWGGWVSGAFTLLSVAAGGGAVAIGVVSRRQIRRSGQTGQVRFTGAGLGMAGDARRGLGGGDALPSLAWALGLHT